MKNATILALTLLGLAACGDDGGGGGGADASIDVVVSTNITISGVASEIGIGGRTPRAGVAVTVFKVSDDSMIATTTTDAQGAFSLTAPSNGSPVNGYLMATKTGLKDTYLYPPGPLSMDYAGVTVLMLTPQTQMQANSIGGASAPDTTKGWIGVLVVDGQLATSTPSMGAKLTASPMGEIHYNSSSGLPQAQAMSTATDGIGYVMNVPAGEVTVGATKTGTTFKSHAIKARADKITLTLVTP